MQHNNKESHVLKCLCKKLLLYKHPNGRVGVKPVLQYLKNFNILVATLAFVKFTDG